MPFSRDAAIEWLVSTDQVSVIILFFGPLFTHGQPIQALQHPSFQKMIHIAARATNGVKFPDRRQTWKAVINLLKQQMMALHNLFNGEIGSHVACFFTGLILQCSE
jgi:hypothetical protein